MANIESSQPATLFIYAHESLSLFLYLFMYGMFVFVVVVAAALFFFMLPQANACDIWIVWIDETIMYENDDDDDENNNENDEHRKLYDLLNGSIFETKKPTNFNEIE